MDKKIIKTRHVKICLLIGLGYWRDFYDKERTGVNGVTHNLILLFLRIQWSYLEFELKKK